MQTALNELKIKPDHALIDGFSLPNHEIPNEGIIKGDEKIDIIQAASIIAKVTRDRIMDKYNIIFPEFGFSSHKGYGTKKHLDSLHKWKATPIHRKSFKPVGENFPTICAGKNRSTRAWRGAVLRAPQCAPCQIPRARRQRRRRAEAGTTTGSDRRRWIRTACPFFHVDPFSGRRPATRSNITTRRFIVVLFYLLQPTESRVSHAAIISASLASATRGLTSGTVSMRGATLNA